MIKKVLFLLAFPLFVLAGCIKPDPEDPGNQEQPEPVVLEPIKCTVPVTDNWVFSGTPSFTFQTENPNEVSVKVELKCRITTDTKVAVTTLSDSVLVAPGKQEYTYSLKEKLDPGFYQAMCSCSGRIARNFVFGVNPLQIVSAPDKQDDFDEFWEAGKAQLAAIDMKPNLIELPSKSSAARKVYLVELQSVPDGLEGDPVTVRGYYLEPQDGQQHPVIMHFYGYDDQRPSGTLYCPAGGSSAEYAEFYLSHRGQYINNRKADQRTEDGLGDLVNIYGDWFAYNFGKRDGYYYRGAFLDCVQAIRFMATRSTSDMNNLFAEGSSQGGALTYAAAALSDYPLSAAAPCVAFLGDFPDYFTIAGWPANVAKSKKGSMTDEEMYRFLSYFDTKNLATRISCPIIASVCLQDGTCPPHTNIAPYNNLLSTDKQVYFYPELQHAIPSDWNTKIMKFFKERMK